MTVRKLLAVAIDQDGVAQLAGYVYADGDTVLLTVWIYGSETHN